MSASGLSPEGHPSGDSGEGHRRGDSPEGHPSGDSAPFVHPVAVRFRDLDPMGHAHHTLALVYFEEARAALWRRLTGRAGLDGIDYILAEATLRWRARILFPQTATVAVRVARVGGRSFVLDYELRSDGGELLTEGRTVQVMFDYGAGVSKEIPPDLRERLEALRSGAG
ncbi:MAG TPA: thioesterase family protein [Longimicrobiales bacterium]|nr:thioesterase family protein [Longimicrobiales bacterium]